MATFFGDRAAFNFVQLKSGHWAGQSLGFMKCVIWVSKESFEAGQSPDRFKWTPCKKASEEEMEEYWAIMGRLVET